MHKTPLNAAHVALGAKMVEFAGWEMPIQYTSIIDEHMAVRGHAGAFDVSHMGAFVIGGRSAGALINRLSTNDVAGAPQGKCVYTQMLNEEGKILDDTIITVLGGDEFFMVPNAATEERMRGWIQGHLEGQTLKDESMDIAKIAVQGPAAERILGQLTSYDLSQLRWFWGGFLRLDRMRYEGRQPSTSLLKGRVMLNGPGSGVPAFVSRTGYTGEDGFEVFCENAEAALVWNAVLEKGEPLGLKPVGLGARDTLRLEKALLLSGTDFDGRQSSLQTGPQWVIDWDHEFIGKGFMVKQKQAGGYDKLVCMACEGRGIPRHGYAIKAGGTELGKVTSGTLSPVLRNGIAMGYVPLAASKIGNKVEIEVRDAGVPAEIVKPPFVK